MEHFGRVVMIGALLACAFWAASWTLMLTSMEEHADPAVYLMAMALMLGQAAMAGTAWLSLYYHRAQILRHVANFDLRVAEAIRDALESGSVRRLH